MKRIVIAVTIVAASALRQTTGAEAMQPQSSTSQSARSDGPSLTDTVAFMNRILEDDGGGAIRTAGNCELLLVRYHLGNVTLPDGTTKFPGDYDNGIPDRYQYTWSIIDPSLHLDSDFNLKDIDPNSIKVNEVWSVEVIDARQDKFDSNLPSKDRSLITFGTSNLVKAIQQTNFIDHVAVANAHETGAGDISFLLQPGTTDRLSKYASGDLFLIYSNDRAVRFAKAFKHAVELCGGKPSAF
jgi:hypothetical protein